MQVYFIEPRWSEAYDDYDYDNSKILATRNIKDYDKFIRFIKAMKGKDVIINDSWYTIRDYALNFPEDNKMMIGLYVYVCTY